MGFQPIVEAENWLHDFGAAGVTRPQVFACSDGVDRVLKITGISGATPAMLTAEWVGSLVAIELDVPTPRPSIVRVAPEALATAPPDVRDTGQAGYAFGSEYVRHAMQPQGVAAVESATNHVDLLSRLWVVDAWLGVEDRMHPDFGRNLLVNNEGKARVLMAIDFGLSMAPALYPIVGSTGGEGGIPRTWPGLMQLLDAGIVRAALDELEAVTEAEIVRIVRTTPEDWSDDARKGSVTRYLLQRQLSVRSAVSQALGLV